jgi:membrane associated rhomboid family serine protease
VVTQAAHENQDAPIWARDEAFPIAPNGWGWVDFKGKRHSCDSATTLIAAIRDDRDAGVELVWTPAHKHLILPEEMADADDAVRTSRQRRAADNLLDSLEKLRWFGSLLAGLALYLLYQGWHLAPPAATRAEHQAFALHAMLSSMSMGITLLMLLIFAFIPWYQAHKRRRELNQWTDGDRAALVPSLRFETWLAAQKAPVTTILLGLISLVALAQIFGEVKTSGWGAWLALFHNWHGSSEAGLIKEAYRHGDVWRLFTAPFLHGNVVHFLMNASAMLYLGKRLEIFARWPHLPLVFLFAACIGGEASARFVAAPSVGASGGLMGWLGFLLVFESLHGRLVPRAATRRLLAGIVLTGIIGLVEYRFIDNAAHLGGLLAGMLYALIVFPKSASSKRPNTTLPDRLAGGAALAVLVLSAGFAILKILAP